MADFSKKDQIEDKKNKQTNKERELKWNLLNVITDNVVSYLI
jgi:hypothetical protein